MLERKIRRYKLMDAHRKLVREGKLLEGRLVYIFLERGGSLWGWEMRRGM